MRYRKPMMLVSAGWICTLAVGVGVTVFWLGKLDGPDLLWGMTPSIAVGIGLAIPLTLANIALRWSRWHFLTRRIGMRLHTRDSLLLYIATLPGIMTPFSVGELVRAPLVGKKYAGHRVDVVLIWPLERATDLFVLAALVSIVRWELTFVLIFGAIWLVVLVSISTVYRGTHLRQCTSPLPCAVLLLSTTAAWLTPGVALWGILRLLGDALAFPAALEAFSSGTILGGLSGLPLGTGVTGSSVITLLQQRGIEPASAILGTAIFRAGTAWFAVALGLIVAWIYRRWLLSLWRWQPKTDHFDRIAQEYPDEIPRHIRDRLLTRKVDAMRRQLGVNGDGGLRCGLDLGCGQGWYACEMAKLGHEMVAVDLSRIQVKLARRYVQGQHVETRFAAASAAHLPFPDDSFDFAYAINMVHHVLPRTAQRELFAEVVRVLKPGGVFFLHEINVTNPVFRLYMSYLFPLIRTIDEGNEQWIRPRILPPVDRARWHAEIDYFTFLPDFLPAKLVRPLAKFERVLEQSRLQNFSAHYMARLVKER